MGNRPQDRTQHPPCVVFQDKAIYCPDWIVSGTSSTSKELHMVSHRPYFFLHTLLSTMLILCISVSNARATTDFDGQYWVPFYLTFPLSDTWKGYFEVNPRVGDSLSEFDQLLIRPALGYVVTPRLSLWQGYAWVTNYRPEFRGEHRIFQQLVYTRKFSSFHIMNRSRLEERIIQRGQGTGIRARTMLRANIPLESAPLWSFVVYDEIFVNLTTVGNGPLGGFDQNRLFLGFNRTLTPEIKMDIGYQNQAINNRSDGLVNRVNHILLIQIFVNL